MTDSFHGRFLLPAFYALALTCLPARLNAQASLEKPDLGVPSKVAPAYFGPNAFPIPDMPEGRCSDRLQFELSCEGWLGHHGDRTVDIFLKTRIPLFTDRVNLVLWLPAQEFYWTTPESRKVQRVEGVAPSYGHGASDVYVTTDIQALRQGRWWPDIVIRAAMKTASGGKYYYARHYDSPGYFFDATISRSTTRPLGPFRELRLAVSGGFLCWQTDAGRQNDAVMYGVLGEAVVGPVSLSACFGGYSGWEKDGDRPMSVKLRAGVSIGRFETLVRFQYGIRDFPYTQISAGCMVNFNVLSPRKAPESSSRD